MRAKTSACFALVSFLVLVGCGGAEESAAESEFDCPSTATVASVSNLNYQSDCVTATSEAEERLDNGHYRRACQQATASASLPPAVASAHVTECLPTDGRGVFLNLEVCCSEPVVIAQQPESVLKADGTNCPVWHTRARAGGLHYPDAKNCAEIIPETENNQRMTHYRNACMKAVPRSTRPIEVLVARVVECRSGGEVSGVVVDVELCCDAKVFEESEFRELVWKRPLEEVRAALGDPLKIIEWPEGPHWTYPHHVVRDDQVFPGVTVVIENGRVESYSFQQTE